MSARLTTAATLLLLPIVMGVQCGCGSFERNARAYAIGAGRILNAKWLRGAVSGWDNEMAIAYVRPNGKATVYPVPWEGSFVWAGVEYR